ncbi:OLC1v1019663C1 [Oldenlandia corymbosa var. corymbosa]|uniref:OLC1v1019663C1 n=1 Tax=Oldenlandia corymbosa var. corymbosa TaxID=529605 RepID=A0AAV1EER1_OLDCO|nr:OLC1v1019663C1 [Oldenlandia corymbosa var. corymbosa]
MEELGQGSTGQNDGGDEQKMNIFLKLSKTVGLTVKTSDTVRNLKTALNDKEVISECLQDIFFGGDRLMDDQKLVDCGIQQNSSLLVFVQNFSPLLLYVKLLDGQNTINVEARSCDTIQDVKSSIGAKRTIKSYDFNLICAGKLLEEDKTLASLNIEAGSTLHMIIAPKEMLAISVKMPSGEILKMEVRRLYTVSDIRTVVESMVGYSVDDLSLAYDGVQLENSNILSSCNITEGSMLEFLEMAPQILQVFLKDPDSKTLTFFVYREELISMVKDKVFRKIGIPTHVQRLMFDGKYLKDDRSLASYNIQKDSTLHLSVWKSSLVSQKNNQLAESN